MDLQPSQNSHDEGDRLQTSESLSGFFSRMTVSNKTMERIMRQDSNISSYDGFRIGGIGKVLNQIGLNQRKHHIIYKVSSGEFAIPMEFTGNVMEMQLIPKEEILEELSRLREEIAVTMKWIHIGTIEVVIKATFKEGIDSEIHLSIMDRRINNLRDGCLGTMIGNLKEYIEIPRIFKEFAKVMAPDPIRIPRIGGVDIIIKDHSVLDRTMSSRIEYSSRMSFSKDRITGYKGKEKDLARVLTPQEIRQPIIGRYDGMLEIAGHEFLVAGVAGRENGCMTLGLSFLEDHKPWGRKGADILLVLRREKAFNRIMPINFRSKRGDFNAKLTNPKMQDKRKFGKALLSFRQQGLIDSDSFYEESEKEIKNLREALDLAKYRKDFRPLLKETESAKRKWEEIHTQRVRELKQVCNNLPKLAIPQDEDELVVYTDAIDYKWAAVLMKTTTTGEEPCRYTGGLFTEQQTQVWHINKKEFFEVWKAFKKWPLFLLAKEFTLKVDNTNVKAFLKNKLESKIEKAPNSVMLRLRHLRENLEELDREFGRLAVNAQVAGQVQRADLDKVQTNIRSSLVASTALWNVLLEPIRKASPSVMTRELREQGSKPALRVQDSKPVAADSSTACTRPSSDSGETATDESQGVKTSDDSSQPSTSGVIEGEISLRPMTGTSKTNTNELSSSSSSAWQVYQIMWEKLISRKGVNPSKTIIETTGKYNRVWMMEGSKPEEVRECYEFGALASVHTMSPKQSPLKERRYLGAKIHFSSSRDGRKRVSSSVSFHQAAETRHSGFQQNQSYHRRSSTGVSY
ncbi:movement protein [Sesamum angolense]|uniref:Movement protein n=1 Tax=Sesamum angolense TaxID=2727404 RepID=A0AAE1WB94_9LAMI|nr:movement protein [Sesamum angolense]